MDENMSISNAEMKVMNHIWKTGAMITVPEMLAILNEEGEEWTYPTVATFLRRLEAKGILGVTKKGNKLCYFPLVSKESRRFCRKQIRRLLKKFSGCFPR